MAAEPLDATAVTPAKPGSKKTRKVLVKKAKQGANIKKYAWLAGHGMTLVFGGIYIIFYNLRWFFLKNWWWTPRICYRLSFVGVLISYTITVITTFGGVVPNYVTLLATENFQNLLLAAIWLVSRSSAFKLVPYYAVALLQLASTFNVKPILKLQDPLSDAIAASEVILIFALLFDTLLFRGTSGFALAIYLMFYWLRVNFSPYTQAFLLKIVKFIDDKIMVKQKPEIKEKWEKFKDFVEFRRSQTKEMYEKELEKEPEVADTSDHTQAGQVAEKGEQMEVVGQRLPENPKKDMRKHNPEGVTIPKTSAVDPVDKAFTSSSSTSHTTPSPSAPQQRRASTAASASSSVPQQQQQQTPVSTSQARAPSPAQKAPAAAGTAVPAAATGAFNTSSQSATQSANDVASQVNRTATQSSERVPIPQAQKSVEDITRQAQGKVNTITSQAQTAATDAINRGKTQTSPIVGQASGRISAPGTPGKHSLDPRQQLIDHAQKIKTTSQENVEGAASSAQSELQKIQQAAHAQIASSQANK
ncbi:Nucleoporin POM33 [Cyberlindnera fabianii]|uniref:Nucleoporin POM33 n=1 Tax=Cyberlindnera fabianii TaxID=36022 RepID=A0A1V2LEP6_CYBFA|nr:Nucleoporin POM33 [Cyberlindnera fabianii]